MSCRCLQVFACLSLLLAACSSNRPEGIVCKGVCPAERTGPVVLMKTVEQETGGQKPPSVTGVMAGTELREQVRDLMRQKAETVPVGVPERALAELPSADEGRLRVLALSSGGPFGAFGAGFLKGWSRQTGPDLARPERFDVVTGVSAGALLATHAFLGSAGDAVLERQYTTISTADVFQRRSFFRALFSNALFDTVPLRRTLEGLVTADLLDEVADATTFDPADGRSGRPGRPGRLLLVLAVDLDSGLPRIFDLGMIAREKSDPDRIDHYIDALMASAAIPVAFPPVFVDGAMHVDGGARLALFFNRFMEDQRAAIEDRTVLPPKLDIIVNAEVTVAPACTENTLIGIGGRSVDVVLNQLTLDGLYRTIAEAERDGAQVRYVTAEDSGCGRPDDPTDPFEPAFLRCLFEHGLKVGAGEAPWSTGLEDFPSLETLEDGAISSACAAG